MNIVLQRAKTIERDRKPNTVTLGSTVGLESDRGDVSYTIVSPLEIDLESNKIPEDGILGAAVLHKKLGDTFSIVTPKGVSVSYKVTSIS